MNSELEAIRAKWAEKTAAKYDGLVALQAAKLAEDSAILAANPDLAAPANPDNPLDTSTVWQNMTIEERAPFRDAVTPARSRTIHQARGIQGDEGRLDAEHLAMCDAYVAAHPGEFTDEIQGMTLEQLVQAVDAFRAAGMVESELRIEVWLRHHFEPQNIGGEVQARIRIAGLT